jgi:NhaP-type Na+/H+ or K+/H+ antiporter
VLAVDAVVSGPGGLVALVALGTADVHVVVLLFRYSLVLIELIGFLILVYPSKLLKELDFLCYRLRQSLLCLLLLLYFLCDFLLNFG